METINNKVNEITVSYSGNKRVSDMPQIKKSEDVAKLVFDNWDKSTIELKETFKVVLMSNANKVRGICELSSGGITGCYVDVRMIMAIALKTLSPSIILVHNHPSGTLKPSEADKNITTKIKKACQLLDMSLLDHLIITPEGGYFSFTDEGII